jgi:hypothetical protein
LADEQLAGRRTLRQLAAFSPSVAATVASAAVVFAAALLRQAGIPKIETLWAEDGTVFLQCAYDHGPLGCVGQAYQGYLHLVPRIIAAAATAVPPTAVAATIAILAALFAAGAATIAGRSIADATSSQLAGFLGAVGLGLVWQAGREILGNAANLHWVLFGSATIAIVCSWLGARISPWTIGLAAITGLTSAFSPLIAIFSAGAVVMRRPRALRLFIVSTCAAIVQAGVELTSHRETPAVPGVPADRLLVFFRDDVIRHGFFGQVPMPAGLVVPVLAVLALAGVAFAHRDRRVVVIGVAFGVAALVATGIALPVVSIVLNRAANPRYAYLPDSMMVAALAVVGGFLAAGLARGSPPSRSCARLVMPSLVAVVGVGFALSFRLETRASGGPDVPVEIRAAAATCVSGGFATIFISPRPATDSWAVAIPCTRLVEP